MLFLGIDLGSTNIKAGLYDEALRLMRSASAPVVYERHQARVEFDADAYVCDLVEMLGRLLQGETALAGIGLTGQAESLVLLDAEGRCLGPAISWMDERSLEECAEIEQRFPAGEAYARTGQLSALPTWPASKLLWIKKHEPERFRAAAHVLLLKDFVVYRLTGVLAADMSIATFSYYFDIYEKRYWGEMLDFIGLSESQLPPLREPCTCVGELKPELAAALGLSAPARVNLGTLDHFAGMIGTGNTEGRFLNLSTGTVLGMAIAAPQAPRRDCGIALHYGFQPDRYIMLPVAESGGACLEWFRRNFLPEASFAEIDRAVAARGISDIVFLPYLLGVNAPELEREVCGLFYGLRAQHDAYDLARAVMEGVAFLLKRNCAALAAAGARIEKIIATGGGAKSALWCQMQADVSGLPVEVPENQEAACRGAALLTAVEAGVFASYGEAAERTSGRKRRFTPAPDPRYAAKYKQFDFLYGAMREARALAGGSAAD